MPPIDADTFINAWKDFSEKFTFQNPDWKEAYDRNVTWSNKFLGGKLSSSNASPIGNYFKEKFGLRYRTEDGSFDLAFSSKDNYKQIPCINRNEISYFDIEEKLFYPTSYDIIIEIENECIRAYEEMTKLTWVRSPLKVLVTYNSRWDKENEMLVNSFKTIIEQSNQNFKENRDTEYLLIIGNNTNELNWTFYKFDSEGNLNDKSLN